MEKRLKKVNIHCSYPPGGKNEYVTTSRNIVYFPGGCVPDFISTSQPRTSLFIIRNTINILSGAAQETEGEIRIINENLCRKTAKRLLNNVFR